MKQKIAIITPVEITNTVIACFSKRGIIRTDAGEKRDADNFDVIGPLNASLSQDTIYAKDPCATYINHDAHITNMTVGAMRFLLVSVFHNNGINGISEERNKRGGTKMYTIVAEKVSNNMSDLDSLFLPVGNARK